MDKIILAFVDNGIEWQRQKEILMRPDPNMPFEMFDISREGQAEWKPWKSIQSTVTDVELIDIENQIGRKLPSSYKDFLKYKHFYSLHTTKGFRTFEHVIHRWKKELLERLLESDWREFMLERGLVWFGNYEDFGFLCFDTNHETIDNEFSIVLIDHEEPDHVQTIYNNFLECLKENTATL